MIGGKIMHDEYRIRHLTESCIDHLWGDPADIFIQASTGKAYNYDGFAGMFVEYDDPGNISIDQWTLQVDANKVPVYTNDVLQNKARTSPLYIVSYSKSEARYMIQCTIPEGTYSWSLVKILDDMVVVGTVYDMEVLNDREI